MGAGMVSFLESFLIVENEEELRSHVEAKTREALPEETRDRVQVPKMWMESGRRAWLQPGPGGCVVRGATQEE